MAHPTITPALFYRDARAALDFLQRAFGFEMELLIDKASINVQPGLLQSGLIERLFGRSFALGKTGKPGAVAVYAGGIGGEHQIGQFGRLVVHQHQISAGGSQRGGQRVPLASGLRVAGFADVGAHPRVDVVGHRKMTRFAHQEAGAFSHVECLFEVIVSALLDDSERGVWAACSAGKNVLCAAIRKTGRGGTSDAAG